MARGSPIFDSFGLNQISLIVHINIYQFIYLLIYLFIGNPFTNNFVCCQNNWEHKITHDNSWKKSNDLIVCFPGKSETKPKPNLTLCHCKGTSPVHFWLTCSCASVFCFSLSFLFFFLCSLLLEFTVASFCLHGGYWCNQRQCKPEEANDSKGIPQRDTSIADYISFAINFFRKSFVWRAGFVYLMFFFKNFCCFVLFCFYN